MKKDILKYIKDNNIKDTTIIIEEDNLSLTVNVTDTVSIFNNITFRTITKIPDIEKATEIIFKYSDKWYLYLKFQTYELDITNTCNVLGTPNKPLDIISISINGSNPKIHNIVNEEFTIDNNFTELNHINSIISLRYEI